MRHGAQVARAYPGKAPKPHPPVGFEWRLRELAARWT
jgi:hypothetical protein